MEIAGRRSFGTVLYFESYLLIFHQRSHACTRDRALMNENIFAAIIASDESETFGFVEPFYFSGNHTIPSWPTTALEAEVTSFAVVHP